MHFRKLKKGLCINRAVKAVALMVALGLIASFTAVSTLVATTIRIDSKTATKVEYSPSILQERTARTVRQPGSGSQGQPILSNCTCASYCNIHRDHDPGLGQQSITSKHSLNFPFPAGILKTLRELLNAPWVEPLRMFLCKRPSSSTINVVVADSKYSAPTINWLVSALVKTDPPLENVLVIALDRDLHTFLHSKGLASLHVDTHTVIQHGDHEQMKRYRVGHIWIIRCTIFRLLNHWGYNVATYDTDALVLRNTQHLFDAYPDSDIIGSSGTWPKELGKDWGVTFCMGFAFFRSTKYTELLWETLRHVHPNSFDDQVKINYALKECNITWHPTDRKDQVVHGECQNGLKVTILPQSVVCRRCHGNWMAQQQQYYIWHQLSKKEGQAKVESALKNRVWFLRNEWKNASDMKGIAWLKSVSN